MELVHTLDNLEEADGYAEEGDVYKMEDRLSALKGSASQEWLEASSDRIRGITEKGYTNGYNRAKADAIKYAEAGNVERMEKSIVRMRRFAKSTLNIQVNEAFIDEIRGKVPKKE